MNMQEKLMMEMIRYYRGDAKRIQHFTKVYSYASLIGKMEDLGGREQYVLELAALVHDIGIKISEEKYGYNNGKLQEQEGPAEAKKLLERLGVDPEDIAGRTSPYLYRNRRRGLPDPRGSGFFSQSL